MKLKKNNKLTTLLSFPAMDGSIALAAASGFFTLENVFTIAFIFIAGPAAIISAAIFQGTVFERMFTALISGIIATVIVVLSAGFGPKIIFFVNLNILKVVGGIAIISIGFLVMGLKLPEKVPTIIMIIGFIISLLWR